MKPKCLLRQLLAKVMCRLGKHRTRLESIGNNIGMRCIFCDRYLAWLPSRARLLKVKHVC